MVGHYILIGVCIAIIIFYQAKVFNRTCKKRKQFDNIFPDNAEEEWVVLKKESVQIVSKKLADALASCAELETKLNEVKVQIQRTNKSIEGYNQKLQSALADNDVDSVSRFDSALKDKNSEKWKLCSQEKELTDQVKKNKKQIEDIKRLQNNLKYGTRYVIIDSINKYLEKNKEAVTDFNLIRDIIDRNCDIIEEEIQTQIPIPLYFGLMGTMLGILIGVAALVVSGSLDNLLSTFTLPPGVAEGSQEYEVAKIAFEKTATSGVTALFGGVALAMISSIVGIFLTTIGSLQSKNIKSRVESKKHAFISWLQAELLPKISSDLSSALVKLGNDLLGFNSTFSSNAKLLQSTIVDVSKATTEQSQLLQLIEKLDIARIAKANINVYENLKNCTQEISSLAHDMHEIQSNIRGVGSYMEDGINEYKNRHTYIQDAAGNVDLAIQKGNDELTKRVSEIFTKYDELLNNLYMHSEATTKELAKKYEAQVENLHKAIVEKLSDIHQLENELKNLVSVKTSIANLEKATTEQNRKIDSLTNAIKELALAKTTGGATSVTMKMPQLYKIFIIAMVSVISVTGLFFLIIKILEIIGVI